MWDLIKFSNNIAIICDNGNIVTYKELDKLQKSFSKNIENRSLVFIVATNTLESLVAYVSCIMNHHVVVLLDENIDKVQLEKLINDYSPHYIFISLKKEFDNDLYSVKNRFDDYVLLNIKQKIEYEINDDLALMLSTSGSTGSAKMVRISYENLLSNAKSIIDYLNIKESDRSITSLMMSYTYGLSIINTYLLAGASIVLTQKKIHQLSFWKIFNEFEVTSFSGVPYMYELFRKMNIDKLGLKSLKVMTQAGGKLGSELQEYFGKFAIENDIKFYIMYGQTEATARMTYLPSDLILKKSESIGKAIKGGKLSLVNEKGESIKEANVIGEVIYEGKNVSMGYASDFRDIARGNESNYILNTGDYGYFDEDGCWYVTGRKDKFIKILGKRINLCELEEVLFDKYKERYICRKRGGTIEIAGSKGGEEVKEYLSKLTNINMKLISFAYEENLRK